MTGSTWNLMDRVKNDQCGLSVKQPAWLKPYRQNPSHTGLCCCSVKSPPCSDTTLSLLYKTKLASCCTFGDTVRTERRRHVWDLQSFSESLQAQSAGDGVHIGGRRCSKSEHHESILHLEGQTFQMTAQFSSSAWSILRLAPIYWSAELLKSKVRFGESARLCESAVHHSPAAVPATYPVCTEVLPHLAREEDLF